MAKGVKISVKKRTGLLTKNGLERFKKNVTSQLKGVVAQAFYTSSKETAKIHRQQISNAFNVKKSVFAKAIGAKIFNSKPDRMPALEMHHGIWWFSAHESNNFISVNRKQYMVIPFSRTHSPYNTEGIKRVPKTLGVKTLRLLLADLKRRDETFIRKSKKGNLILFIKVTKENRGTFRTLVKKYKMNMNVKRVKNGQPVPFAVLKKKVHMKKRYDFVRKTEQIIIPIINSKLQNSITFKNVV